MDARRLPESLRLCPSGQPGPAVERVMIVAEKCRLERRADGVILVRVPSTGEYGEYLPDAVFTFRPGDPQYSFWLRECNRRDEPQA